MNEVIKFLDSKGFKYKIDGQQAVAKCPNCGKDKLYFHLNSGVYHCFRCEVEDPTNIYAKGHISKLKEEFGDILSISSAVSVIQRSDKNQRETDFTDIVNRYHYNIMEDTGRKARKYLFLRGINKESIERFKLGLTSRYEQDWIAIPIFENNIPKLIKYRKLPPYNKDCKIKEKCIRESGGKSIMFNTDVIDEYDEIIITEGEIDAITLLQHGYENVVGVTGGCGTLLPEWYDKLNLKTKIYLVMDSDKQGQDAAKNVWADRLGYNRCYNILLPTDTDVNDYFKNHSKEDFDELIKQAQRFSVAGIISVSDALQEMYEQSLDPDNLLKYELPWPEINKLMDGGLTKGRLTTICAQPGTGKTSFSLQILYHFAKTYNLPSLMFCMEMPAVSLITKIIQLEFDLRIEEINYSDALIYEMKIGKLPIYFGYSSKVTPEIFYNTMVEVKNRYGVGIGVFDNLQRMIRTGEESDMGRASSVFKDLTMDLNIPFILISQPRKLNNDKELPTYDMMKGSSAIPADCDEAILMHRFRLNRNKSVGSEVGSFSPETKIVVDKGRFSSGGLTTLWFEGAKSRFDKFNKEV